MSDLNEKRNIALSRLEARNQDRKLTSEGTNTQKAESVQFQSIVSALNDKIQALLNACDTVAASGDTNALSKQFDEITKELDSLKRVLSEYSSILPPYESRKGHEMLQNLQQLFQDTQNRLVQKKKFTFRDRKKDTGTKVEQPKNASEPPKETNLTNDPNVLEVRGLNGTEKIIQEEEVEGKDLHLMDLSNCRVTVKGCASTIHATNLHNCLIVALPVQTSFLIHHCKETTLVVACQQLRMHESSNCTVYLHVTSNAIMEACKDIKVAPYSLEIDDEWFKKAKLDKDRNNWNALQDFNWLSNTVPSPNWSVLDDNDRKLFTLQ